MNAQWTYKAFSLLTTDELYKILKLRSEVFVIEQQCIYADADNKDQDSYHLCGWADTALAAYARVLPPGLSYREASIGRVLTAAAFRKTGLGKQLMEKALQLTLNQFPGHPIRIGAQYYLEKFYSEQGFAKCGEIYLEDGIEHIEMLFKQ